MTLGPEGRSAPQPNVIASLGLDHHSSGRGTDATTFCQHLPDGIQQQVAPLGHPPPYDYDLRGEALHQVEHTDGKGLGNIIEVVEGLRIARRCPGRNRSRVLAAQPRQGRPRFQSLYRAARGPLDDGVPRFRNGEPPPQKPAAEDHPRPTPVLEVI